MRSSFRSPGETVVSAISRNATTGFLSLSRSIVICAPDEIMRARWLASNTRSKRLSTLSMQSSTVTRAMASSLLLGDYMTWILLLGNVVLRLVQGPNYGETIDLAAVAGS